MTTTQAENAPDPHPDSVSYYLHYDGENIRAPYADNSYKVAGGGLIASPVELVAFGNALLGGVLVSDDSGKNNSAVLSITLPPLALLVFEKTET